MPSKIDRGDLEIEEGGTIMNLQLQVPNLKEKLSIESIHASRQNGILEIEVYQSVSRQMTPAPCSPS
jgi:HSP20 family molecular chaperone IbpA